MVPVEESVAFGCFHQFSIVLGLLFMKAFALLVISGDNRFSNYIGFALPVPMLLLKIVLLQCVFKSETPLYLVENDRKQEAKDLIEELYNHDVYFQVFIDLERGVRSLENPIYEGFDMKKIRLKVTFLGIYVAVLQQISGISIINTYGIHPIEINDTS